MIRVPKVLFVTFRGERSCVQHALLNALDMDSKGIEARLILEGESTRLVRNLEESKHPVYMRAKEKGLIEGICRACSQQMGVLEFNETLGIPILSDLSGHPALGPYIQEGYSIITL
jgi:hypothetical protein